MDMRYYAIGSTVAAKPIHADTEWLERCRPTLFPCGCKHLTPRSTLGTVVVEAIPPSTRVGWASPLGSVYVAEENLLLDMLGSDGMAAVEVASVQALQGLTSTKYLAFMPRHSVLTRGQSMSTLKGACEQCGHARYYPQPTNEREKWYLVRESVKGQAAVYNGGAGGVLLREDIFKRTDWSALKAAVRFREMPIVDEPLDGLPTWLPAFLSPEQQNELGDLLARDVTEHDQAFAEFMATAKGSDNEKTIQWVMRNRRT